LSQVADETRRGPSVEFVVYAELDHELDDVDRAAFGQDIQRVLENFPVVVAATVVSLRDRKAAASP